MSEKLSVIQSFKKSIFKLIESFISFIHFSYLIILETFLKNCDTVLDLGCGSNSMIQFLRRKPTYSVGVEIYEKYIKISKKKKIHNNYFCYDILKIDELFSPKSFDCILLLEVIEHLDMLDGIKLIRKMEKIAKKKIIISTPNGFIHQDAYHGNIYQRHKSSWNINLFKKLNFKIYGIGGWKFFKGERGRYKYRPIKIFSLISIVSSYILFHLPQFSFQLYCLKKIS